MKSMIKAMVRWGMRVRVRGVIGGWGGEGDGGLGMLARALRGALDDRLSGEEQRWVDQIERLRAELDGCAEEISMTDYGAGGSEEARTEAEMEQGKVVMRKVGDLSRCASKPYFWALVLFKLVREFGPTVCLELGTFLGISGAYQGAALKLSGKGKLITLEGSESFAGRAEEHFGRLGLDNVNVVVGRFQDTLGAVLEREQPIDFAFIDGHHDEKATLGYFDRIEPYLSRKAVVVFDDISWSDGMKRAWAALEKHDRIRVSVNLREVGIGIVDDEIERKRSLDAPLIA